MSDDQKIIQKVVKSDCQFVDIHRDPRVNSDDQTILKKFQKVADNLLTYRWTYMTIKLF